MEMEIEPSFQHVTWKVRDFFELPQKNDFYLDSPEFIFSGELYCLRLFPRVKRTNGDNTEVHVLRLSVAFPDRKASCKFGIRWRDAGGEECYSYWSKSLENYYISRSSLEEHRNGWFPDGIFTLLCCMRLSEESRAGSSAQGEEEGFPGHNASFSCRWSPVKMELSTELPCTHVQLTVRKYFQLPKKMVDSLTSPEFRFAGDTYCLRFRPNGDTADTDLQLVRLTSTFPERTVCYRVGYKQGTEHGYPHNSRSLVGKIGVCLSRSILDEESPCLMRIDGTLSLVLFLRLGDWSSSRAGTSDAAQRSSGLPGIQKLQSDYRRLLQKETESDACVVVCGKEFPVHRNVLRARSTVFEAMFGHDTAEKESGRVVINDLDPDSFWGFLDYLYTGDVQDKISDDNAVGLYVAADKYDVNTLKSECVEHLRQTLSVDSFCDVMTLALRHREEDLLQEAISYFKDNLQRIIITAKWQQFMSDNSTSANELLIKSLVPGKQ